MLRIMLVIVVLLITTIPVVAQDTPDLLCKMDDLTPIYESWQSAVEWIDEVFANQDVNAVYDALIRFDFVFDTVRSLCNPLTFSSQESGLLAVIGPIFIPQGMYRVTAMTEAALIVRVDALNGNCEGRGFGSLFNFTSGQGSGGAQAVFTSEGCTALIITDNAREPWTLVFEKLN